MPTAPKRHIPHGRSEKRQDYRRNASDRGYDAAWAKVRDIRRRLSPLCVVCERKGRAVSVEVVDHIVPVHVAPERRLEIENTQSLCRACHARKTNQDIKRYGSAM